MKMLPTDADPQAFVAAVEHPVRRADAERLLSLFTEATGREPVMWGPSIIGFGAYHYRYASGREGDAPAVGFSPRKANLVLYVLGSHDGAEPLLSRLGKHKRSVACVYVNKLADVDLDVLRELIAESYRHTMTVMHQEPGSGGVTGKQRPR
ncbi:hypothetical protein GCM10008096_21670 [Zhihengliuella salsuginis]|uniref:YdhG-like domain-containing protein n=2 Tax=Zhihengliuella salsuginis TaxID=578222 RepID=A0ABQ3GJ71_9MICC|nr:hypothetical protein GCM10008096_21670 [Zhihengliuella salsuginis]